MCASKSTQKLRVASSNHFVTLPSAAMGVVLTFAGTYAVALLASERTSHEGRTIQPQVLDFSWKNRQKAETKQLLQDAKEAAVRGHTQKARDLVHQAAELPVNWNADKGSPQNLLQELDSLPNQEPSRADHSLQEIPSVSELAEPASEDEIQAARLRRPFKQHGQKSARTHGNTDEETDDPEDLRTHSRSSSTLSPNTDSKLEKQNSRATANRPAGLEPINGDRGREYIILHAAAASPAANEAVDREGKTSSSVGASTNGSTTGSEPIVANLSSHLLAALLGAVVMMVGLLLVLLKKFGPNPTFVFKVEMTNSGREAAVVERPTSPALRIAPIYAMKMQMEEEQERQREEAMMQKVFEDNLELREQLEAAA